MKLKYVAFLMFVSIFSSCSKTSNDQDFIKKATGRYLYNSDEVIEVYFEQAELYMVWRGATAIKPLKTDENTFFVKEMNQKIQFLTNPSDHQDYICVVPKERDSSIAYDYIKLKDGEKIPSEYLENKEYDKALEGYLAIKEIDSLDVTLNERNFNSLGYRELRKDKFEEAIAIFKINAALHPESYNVYDSLGEAYLKSGDTTQALENYKQSLIYDSGNERIKRTIKKLEKKE